MDTPTSLLERLHHAADPQDWSRFVRLYTPLLLYWARQAALQEADADDLVQEVLTQLFRKLPEFHYDRDRSFRAWLRTLTLNKWREIQRRRAPLVQQGADLEKAADDDALSAFEETEYRRHLVQQTLRLLQDEFPPSTWQAFQRYVVEGRSADAVATELHVRLGTVYAAKSRVLSRLRQELQGLLD